MTTLETSDLEKVANRLLKIYSVGISRRSGSDGANIPYRCHILAADIPKVVTLLIRDHGRNDNQASNEAEDLLWNAIETMYERFWVEGSAMVSSRYLRAIGYYELSEVRQCDMLLSVGGCKI